MKYLITALVPTLFVKTRLFKRGGVDTVQNPWYDRNSSGPLPIGYNGMNGVRFPAVLPTRALLAIW